MRGSQINSYRKSISGPRLGAFTLIELLVSISIFTIISAIILTNYSKFRSRAGLERTANEIALSARKAQNFALSVKGFETGSGTVFRGWGIYFEKPSSLLADYSKQYVIYADLPPSENKQYDGALERYELFKIETSSRIVSLCGGAKTSPPGNCSLSRIDITYQRPDPSITILGSGSAYSDAEIIIQAPDGSQKTIVIWNTGQIAVE